MTKRLALLLALATIPACATRTGKVAGVVAGGSTVLAVGVLAGGCGGTGEECGVVKVAGGGVLLGTAVVALLVAAAAEGVHHVNDPETAAAPPPTKLASAPVARVRRAPTPIAAPIDPKLVELTVSASVEASLGRCASVDVIGEHVRGLDPTYFERVFLADTAIQRCR
jgi:hypothetical protein